MRKKIRIGLVVLATLLLCSCIASVPFKYSEDQSVYQTPPDKSQIVFLRSSSTFAGGKIPAVLFDVSNEKEILIGAIPNKTKVVYLTDPGKHYYMVHSNEAADFLTAELEPGKTYYVLVRPFPGSATYRFSFAPFRNDPTAEFSLQSENFEEWLKSTAVVDVSDDTKVWYQNNLSDIQEKRENYWPKWSSKPEQQRLSQTINKDDGV